MAIALDAKTVPYIARLAAPQLLLILAIIFSLMALPVPDAGSVRPAIVLMIVYYWAIYRPTLMPPWLCFFAGLLIDMLSGAPLGVNALVFVVVQWLISDQRRFLMGQNYLVLWAVFALVAGLAALMQWGLYGLLKMHWGSPMLPAASVGLSLLCFPIVTIMLIAVHRLLPVALRP